MRQKCELYCYVFDCAPMACQSINKGLWVDWYNTLQKGNV